MIKKYGRHGKYLACYVQQKMNNSNWDIIFIC